MSEVKAKKPFFKKWWFWVVIIIVVIAIATSGGEEEAGPKKVDTANSAADDSSKTSDEAAQKEEETTPSIFKVGDVVELGDTQITLKSAKFVEPAEYIEAEKGKVLAIEFEVLNNSDDSLYFGSEELSISTTDGVQHESYFGHDDGFMNENISAGKKIMGTIYYDVPEDTKYELVYKPTFTWEDETATFEVVPQ
ncbi:DUF4352 domain-containing protein [Caldibacillus lycopersici]|uniref:DUF4352 domain-containing protein n=1 Tax=Perspicuibacillus lycopersici TaxID=1325689 RepID=A0AAE3ITH5_9BACI|nr:DUF4352 domain-containing protein [Perspicuibacillus lycopersici]MCU9613176.1 DUF4352 domain-containing protein [Perspicuibacillus lycopersici]